MDVHQKAIVNIFFTYNWCSDKVKQAVVPFDITTQQYNMLRILRNEFPKPATVSFLKSQMLDKMCDASRIVDRLVQKELIIKAGNALDKRAVDVVISEKGMTLLDDMDKEVNFSDIIASALTLTEAAQLNRLLDKLRG
ncbi:MarR family winged helix-turn-helix transcriptional regulator [Pedobacter sp. PWIIR3]